ncbi:uncharacterized protein C8A04DRAFT_13604 [Dichotomopilus funicola]|uniref:Pathway-specific nitrogen regulator n=1 Tax=Dichotomopilus funicola TaxID=1934379 RepID=A0AAN6V0U6_9PEZI|nr:hypothetical protein C8A04DRAFT_13604 [Dichotomopilus funicola]
MPRKTPELDQDFNIYVDPSSCVREAMDEDTPATNIPPVADEVLESVAPEDSAQDVAAEVAGEDEQDLTEEPDVTPADEDVVETEEVLDTTEVDIPKNEAEVAGEDIEDEEQVDPTPNDDLIEDEPVVEQDDAAEPTTEDNTLATEHVDEESVVENEMEEHSQLEDMPEQAGADQTEAEEVLESESTEEALEEAASGELDEPGNVDAADTFSETADEDKEEVYDNKDAEVDDVHTDEQEASDVDQEQEQDRGPQRLGERKTSLRTEALIQAAARAVVAKIEKRKSGELPEPEDEFDQSMVSTDSQDTETRGRDDYDDDAFNAARDLLVNSLNDQHHNRSQSAGSSVRHNASHSISSDDANDSSSQHEREDDVFSDRSARSSLGSLDPVSDPEHYEGGTIRGSSLNSIKTPHAKDAFAFSERRDSFTSSTTSSQDHHQPSHSSSHSHTISPARTVSNFSTISGLSAYDDSKQGGFVPTHRETRLPFRTPSEIRAMQMASPSPSVFNGSSPSSRPGTGASKRYNGATNNNNNGFSSPTASAQYSPKGRSTPTRLKSARKEAPLVLLHVTLLPLQWAWGDVLNGMDALVVSNSDSLGKTDLATPSESVVTPPPSDQLKTLRDAWRELQSRVGETVLDRGILLPHPQNDYEVLEERLLEALELPLRRRARILECGHYVGPANVPDEYDEDISDDEGGRLSREDKRQWCATCETEIRVEDLGVGKVFRVKVYASNGLMRAGAWEACWKEMERVDVEVEPIVDATLQSELERLALLQDELEEQRRREVVELERAAELAAEAEAKAMVEGLRASSRQQKEQQPDALDAQRSMMPSPAPSGMQLAMRTATPQPSAANTLVRAGTPSAYPVDTSEERRMRDEERMREIYGDSPTPPSNAPTPDHQQQPQHHQHQPSQPQHQQHYPPQTQTQLPPTLPLLTDGRQEHAHQQPRQSRPLPLDENSGFVEVLMEAFKVLLRDPKNVAIIVLCVFVVFMIKRPGLEAQQAQQGLVPAPQVPVVHVSSQVPQAQVQVPEVQVGQGQVGQGQIPQGQIQGVKQVPQVEGVQGLGNGDVAGYEIGMMGEVQAGGRKGAVREVPMVEGGAAEEVVENVVKALPASEEVVVEHSTEQTVEVEVTETESQTEAEAEPEALVEQTDAAIDTRAAVFILPDDMCAPHGPAYPVTPIDELPLLTPEVDNSENSDDDLPANCNPPSTTSSALGPLVTQRRTVRLFETVTETVRVSVVTQTETVSTVVTAIPQTVEETVYETETVRITVSVPVEGQKAVEKKEEKEGCEGKGKKGWF